MKLFYLLLKYAYFFQRTVTVMKAQKHHDQMIAAKAKEVQKKMELEARIKRTEDNRNAAIEKAQKNVDKKSAAEVKEVQKKMELEERIQNTEANRKAAVQKVEERIQNTEANRKAAVQKAQTNADKKIAAEANKIQKKVEIEERIKKSDENWKEGVQRKMEADARKKQRETNKGTAFMQTNFTAAKPQKKKEVEKRKKKTEDNWYAAIKKAQKMADKNNAPEAKKIRGINHEAVEERFQIGSEDAQADMIAKKKAVDSKKTEVQTVADIPYPRANETVAFPPAERVARSLER